MPTYLVFKKSTFYEGIKIFNSLPPSVTIIKKMKAKFKAALRKYLHTHRFYSVGAFFMYVSMYIHTYIYFSFDGS